MCVVKGNRDLAQYLQCCFQKVDREGSFFHFLRPEKAVCPIESVAKEETCQGRFPLSSLELGAGCSSNVSSVLSRAIQRVVVTDGNELVVKEIGRQIKECTSEQKIGSPVQLSDLYHSGHVNVAPRKLLWGCNEVTLSALLAEFPHKFDLIVAAEVLYEKWSEQLKLLLETVRECLAKQVFAPLFLSTQCLIYLYLST